MPNAYTHLKFGREVLARLPEELARVIAPHRDLFLMGLQGPDPFFFYQPLSATPVGRLGKIIHREKASVFFRAAAQRLEALPDRQAGEAYLLGYVCHYALDSACHSYVEYMVRSRGLNHLEMETDFERQLLLRDGKDPARYLFANQVRLNEAQTAVAAALHGITEREMADTLRDMRLYGNLLLATDPAKRALILGVLRAAGKYEKLHGLIMPETIHPRFAAVRTELEKCWRRGVPNGVELIGNYHAFLQGAAPLSPGFDRIFDEDETELRNIKEREKLC